MPRPPRSAAHCGGSSPRRSTLSFARWLAATAPRWWQCLAQRLRRLPDGISRQHVRGRQSCRGRSVQPVLSRRDARGAAADARSRRRSRRGRGSRRAEPRVGSDHDAARRPRGRGRRRRARAGRGGAQGRAGRKARSARRLDRHVHRQVDGQARRPRAARLDQLGRHGRPRLPPTRWPATTSNSAGCGCWPTARATASTTSAFRSTSSRKAATASSRRSPTSRTRTSRSTSCRATRRWRIGNFFVPFSLEQVTNDTNNIFMERSIPTQGIFAADREVGMALYGHTDDMNTTWAGGVLLRQHQRVAQGAHRRQPGPAAERPAHAPAVLRRAVERPLSGPHRLRRAVHATTRTTRCGSAPGRRFTRGRS